MSPELDMRAMVCEAGEGDDGLLVFCIGETMICYYPLSFLSANEGIDYDPKDTLDRRVRGENVLLNLVAVVSEAEGVDPITALQIVMDSGGEGYDVNGKGQLIFDQEVVAQGCSGKRQLLLDDKNLFDEMMERAKEKRSKDCQENCV